MLMDHPKGLYGSEIVSKSDGYISRGTVYTLLERLVEKGLVREVEDPASDKLQMARTRHLITGAGQRSVYEFLREMNLSLPNGAAGAVGV